MAASDCSQQRGGTSPAPTRGSARLVLAAIGSFFLWALIGILTIAFSLVIIVCAVLLWPVDPQRRIAHRLASLWGRAVFWSNPSWRLSVSGREHLDPRTAYVFVANHQSLLDIMALFALRRQFKWIAKRELFAIPLLGWAMALVGYIKLSRGQHGSIRETYDRARRWLFSGMSVLFFPEGTRSLTGEIGPFKNGAFKLAMETATPVVPIIVSGTRDLLMRGSWLFRCGSRVQITVLPPLDPATYHSSEPERLRDETRRLMQTILQRLSPSA